MKRFALLLALAAPLAAQPATVRYGVVVDSAAALAAARWTAPAPALEHGYCIRRWFKQAMSDSPRDTIYAVLAIDTAQPTVVHTDGITFSCRQGQPTMHTHPGSLRLTDCNPSRADQTAMVAEFEIVQCGPAQFVFYYRPSPPPPLRPSPETATVLYLSAATAVVVSNAIWQWDQDPGGYPDKFYPEKQAIHFAAAFGLTQAAIALHVKPWAAVTITSLAGVGFEVSQGYVNRHDVAADVLGSLAGALMAYWLRPVRF